MTRSGMRATPGPVNYAEIPCAFSAQSLFEKWNTQGLVLTWDLHWFLVTPVVRGSSYDVRRRTVVSGR